MTSEPSGEELVPRVAPIQQSVESSIASATDRPPSASLTEASQKDHEPYVIQKEQTCGPKTGMPENFEQALHHYQQQHRQYQQQYPASYQNQNYVSLSSPSRAGPVYGAMNGDERNWSENRQYQHSLTSLPPAVPFPEEEEENEDSSIGDRVATATRLSWIANLILLIVKFVAAVATGSQSILASLADSAVDLISQAVLAVAEGTMTVADEEYPVGRNRLEALAVITCAAIMSMASAFVIQSALSTLYQALRPVHPIRPQLDIDFSMIYILAGATIAKFVLWLFCRTYINVSESMKALSEDHLNDVMSNSAAIFAAVMSYYKAEYWWLDGTTAVLVSVWIIYRWYTLTKEQMDKLVGKAAPASFVQRCHALADRHHPMMRVDVIRAYHMGSRYAVEVEVVLPPEMPLRESHDIALALQHHIESLAKCERAFVHVDYAFRDTPEHKVERKLGSTGGHIKQR